MQRRHHSSCKATESIKQSAPPYFSYSCNYGKLHMSPDQFLHQRTLPNIHSTHLRHWQGKPLKGLYLIENTLAANAPEQGETVLLTPGIFDPVKGEYGPETIQSLLSSKKISAVYEAHFLSDDICGLLDIASVIDDLSFILTHSRQGIKVVGLSGGCMAICAALFELQKKGLQANSSGALLIGPHLIDYPTFYIKIILKLINGDEMLEKVTRHAGHPNVPKNSAAGKAWFADSKFAKAIREIKTRTPRPGFPIPIETRYFSRDTLSNEGRKRLHWYFDCDKPKSSIPGNHRGLFRVPESQQIICDFCLTN